MNTHQIAVIGAGISGITAAYKAAAEGAAVLHFADPGALPGGLVANVGELHGLPWGAAVSGMDFASQLSSAGAVCGVQVVAQKVESIEPKGGGFVLKTADGAWSTEQVILATGARLKDIGIPGAREFKNNGVLDCAWCNAGLFRQRPVIVLGGGNSALQEAMHLARHASSVTIVTRGPEFRASRQYVREAAKLANVHFRWDTEALEVMGSDAVQGLRVRHRPSGTEEALYGDAIFVFIGLAPNAELARDWARCDAQGRLVTDECFETSCKGLFAVGAVRHGYNGDLIAAMGEATAAALEASARIRR